MVDAFAEPGVNPFAKVLLQLYATEVACNQLDTNTTCAPSRGCVFNAAQVVQTLSGHAGQK